MLIGLKMWLSVTEDKLFGNEHGVAAAGQMEVTKVVPVAVTRRDDQMMNAMNEKTFSFAANRANIFPLSMAQSNPASDEGADHSVAGWACGALSSHGTTIGSSGPCGLRV
jgi:hypothetical protein